jgi:Rod binding domain-containing protein
VSFPAATARVLPAAGTPSTLSPAQQSKIAATAKQFEAMALTELLNPIFNTVDTAHGLFGGGEAEAAWKPMMVSELAKNLSAHGGLGLARPVMEQMIRIQENAR